MVSTYTTNKAIEKPASGDYVNTWATPVNADWDIIDKAFGGTTNINVTAVSGTVVLTSTQYQALILNITGTLTANVTYQVPSTVGGQWVVKNGTTGSYTVTISSGGAGTSLDVPQGYSSVVVSDGTNITRSDTTPVAAAGSNTQVQYNSSGSLAGSANLVWDNTNGRFGINNGSPSYSLDIIGTINASAQVRVGTNVRFSDGSTQEVSASISALEFVIDGGGATLTTGIKGDLEIPFGCTITQWTLLADQSGSIVVDIWKDTYANYPPTVADTITASAKPTITTSTKGQSSTLTGWTTSVTAGDTIRFNIDSVTTIQRVTISLKVTRT